MDASVFDGTKTIWMGDVALTGDIDLGDPVSALLRYGDMPTWQEWARSHLKDRLVAEKDLAPQQGNKGCKCGFYKPQGTATKENGE